ncbi:hypothetical protein [Metallosphaera javensis (ex Hofmann et al. 2022)]|uniref:hypothetical protein n=1 Tax=Metallosphaera javensis (ex Hofmann et al. 2022) TaxID=99938 RepID=UPI001EE11E21|nr:hypothetical protein [Metallosphaera javensis (ex Hofmann et al. 2022)]
MKAMKLAPIIGIVLGVALLGLVFSSAVFTYTATRSFTVTVVQDPNADIAITPNNQNLGTYTTNEPFVYLNDSGDLEINFHNVASNAMATFYNAFNITNNLNETVQVNITSSSPHLLVNGYQQVTITLAPGGSTSVSLTLQTYGLSPTTQENYYITITAATTGS